MSQENIEETSSETEDIFNQTGGRILESYPDGRPKLWQCGEGENGLPVDPASAEKNCIHFLDENGRKMAGNPDEKLLEEIKRWRSDWTDIK